MSDKVQAEMASRIQNERLHAWLIQHVTGAIPSDQLQLNPIEGGQSNPTFLVQLGQRQLVLRKKPAGTLLPSAHAIDREFKVTQALGLANFEVAKPIAYCVDPSVIGSEFYVMDFVPGRIFWDPRLPDLIPKERTAIFQAMNDTLAKLHLLNHSAIGLSDFGKSAGYIPRQIARWTAQYLSSATESILAMDHLMEWLPQHIPAFDTTCLVHGDFRMDNMIFHPTEPRILAVLDWELSTLGHPLSDFAYHMMTWRFAPDLFRGLAGSDFAALGIPTENAYLQAYLNTTGFRLQNAAQWEFYIIFNMFRMASILQGVLSRALQGNAASEKALEAGSRAKPIAELAWQQVLNIDS